MLVHGISIRPNLGQDTAKLHSAENSVRTLNINKKQYMFVRESRDAFAKTLGTHCAYVWVKFPAKLRVLKRL